MRFWRSRFREEPVPLPGRRGIPDTPESGPVTLPLELSRPSISLQNAPLGFQWKIGQNLAYFGNRSDFDSACFGCHDPFRAG